MESSSSLPSPPPRICSAFAAPPMSCLRYQAMLAERTDSFAAVRAEGTRVHEIHTWPAARRRPPCPLWPSALGLRHRHFVLAFSRWRPRRAKNCEESHMLLISCEMLVSMRMIEAAVSTAVLSASTQRAAAEPSRARPVCIRIHCKSHRPWSASAAFDPRHTWSLV